MIYYNVVVEQYDFIYTQHLSSYKDITCSCINTCLLAYLATSDIHQTKKQMQIYSKVYMHA